MGVWVHHSMGLSASSAISDPQVRLTLTCPLLLSISSAVSDLNTQINSWPQESLPPAAPLKKPQLPTNLTLSHCLCSESSLAAQSLGEGSVPLDLLNVIPKESSLCLHEEWLSSQVNNDLACPCLILLFVATQSPMFWHPATITEDPVLRSHSSSMAHFQPSHWPVLTFAWPKQLAPRCPVP